MACRSVQFLLDSWSRHSAKSWKWWTWRAESLTKKSCLQCITWRSSGGFRFLEKETNQIKSRATLVIDSEKHNDILWGKPKVYVPSCAASALAAVYKQEKPPAEAKKQKRTWLLPLLPSNVQILEIKILYDHFCHYLSILHRPQTTLCERTSNWCFKSLSMLSMAVMRFSSIPSRAGFPNSAFVKWTQHSVKSENWARSRSDAWRKQFAGSLSVWVHGVLSCLRRLRPSPSSNPLHRFALSGQNTWSLESRQNWPFGKQLQESDRLVLSSGMPHTCRTPRLPLP